MWQTTLPTLALSDELLYQPPRPSSPNLEPRQPRDPLHGPVAGRWVLAGAERELTERAAGRLRSLEPREHASPRGETVEHRQTFTRQETTEFKPIMETEVGRDFPCRADGAPTEEHRFDDGPAAQREIGPGLVNGPNNFVQVHFDREKKPTLILLRPRSRHKTVARFAQKVIALFGPRCSRRHSHSKPRGKRLEDRRTVALTRARIGYVRRCHQHRATRKSGATTLTAR